MKMHGEKTLVHIYKHKRDIQNCITYHEIHSGVVPMGKSIEQKVRLKANIPENKFG